jgi:hypothetical protein
MLLDSCFGITLAYYLLFLPTHAFLEPFHHKIIRGHASTCTSPVVLCINILESMIRDASCVHTAVLTTILVLVVLVLLVVMATVVLLVVRDAFMIRRNICWRGKL